MTPLRVYARTILAHEIILYVPCMVLKIVSSYKSQSNLFFFRWALLLLGMGSKWLNKQVHCILFWHTFLLCINYTYFIWTIISCPAFISRITLKLQQRSLSFSSSYVFYEDNPVLCIFKFIFYFYFSFSTRIKPRAPHRLGKCFTTELYSWL